MVAGADEMRVLGPEFIRDCIAAVPTLTVGVMNASGPSIRQRLCGIVVDERQPEPADGHDLYYPPETL